MLKKLFLTMLISVTLDAVQVGLAPTLAISNKIIDILRNTAFCDVSGRSELPCDPFSEAVSDCESGSAALSAMEKLRKCIFS